MSLNIETVTDTRRNTASLVLTHPSHRPTTITMDVEGLDALLLRLIHARTQLAPAALDPRVERLDFGLLSWDVSDALAKEPHDLGDEILMDDLADILPTFVSVALARARA